MLTSWHYPRPELAGLYIKTFDMGLVTAKGIFARRRMGKTEFLKMDLIPAAEEAGYLTVYANLWNNKENPAAVIMASLIEALEPKGAARILNALQTPIKKLKAGAKVAGVEGSFEVDLADGALGMQKTALMNVLSQFDRRPRKTLLIIDEAQTLASLANSNFSHALRAALDVRRDHIKVVFAGSSEMTLRQMFGRASEPFYNWAQLEPFPLLGKDFVEAMVDKVRHLSTHPISLEDGLRAYQELNQTPLFFREFLARYLAYAFEGVDAAIEFTKTTVYSEEGFQRQWDACLPADRAVLKLIANQASEITGKNARAAIGNELGLGAPVDASTIGNSLRRLGEKHIIVRMEHGKYQFEDMAFADWIRHEDTER